MTKSHQFGFISGFAIALFSSWSYANSASLYNQLVVFGDSLSDSGSIKNRFDRFLARGYELPNYAEYLSEQLLHQPLLPYTQGGTNYAQSGATTFIGQRSTENQIKHYLQQHNDLANANALYILNVGGNDLAHVKFVKALLNYGMQRSKGQAVNISRLIPGSTEIAKQVSQLKDHGAKHILVPNLMPASYFPYFTYELPINIGIYILYDLNSSNHEIDSFIGKQQLASLDQALRNDNSLDGGGPNAFFDKSLSILQRELPLLPKAWLQFSLDRFHVFMNALANSFYDDVKRKLESGSANVLYADTKKLYEEIHLDPKKFGIDNIVLTQCPLGVSSSSSFCNHTTSNKKYLWSDWLHPSPDAHQITAQYYLSLLIAPSYLSSFQNQLQGLQQASNRFINNEITLLHLNTDKSPLLIGLSWLHRRASDLWNEGRLNAGLLHLGSYHFINKYHMVGGLVSLSIGQAHPFSQFSFNYSYAQLQLFHRWRHQRLWLQDNWQFAMLNVHNIIRFIQLGKALFQEKAQDNSHSSYWGTELTLGIDLLKKTNYSLGALVSYKKEYYHIHGYIDQANRSTSMRFASFHLNRLVTQAGVYLDFSNTDKPALSLHTSLLYRKRPAKHYQVPANSKVFQRDYLSDLTAPAQEGLQAGTDVHYRINRHTILGANISYMANKKAHHYWEGGLSVHYQF